MTPAGPDLATLDAEALRGPVEVRTWRDGDRIRPLGMGGTKTLGDLFTDRGVPRSLRRSLPVVTVGGEIAWVAGVAVSESFRLDPGPSGSRCSPPERWSSLRQVQPVCIRADPRLAEVRDAPYGWRLALSAPASARRTERPTHARRTLHPSATSLRGARPEPGTPIPSYARCSLGCPR